MKKNSNLKFRFFGLAALLLTSLLPVQAEAVITLFEKNELQIVITPDGFPIIWYNADKYGVDFTYDATQVVLCVNDAIGCSTLTTDLNVTEPFDSYRIYNIDQYVSYTVFYDAAGKIVGTSVEDNTPPPPLPGNDANDCSIDNSQQSSILSDYIVGETKINTSVSQTGASQFNVPIIVPPATANMGPKLNISYNSSKGSSYLGQGAGITGISSISRCRATELLDGFKSSVNFDANDRFCLDGKRLIAVSGAGIYGADGTEYRTEIDTFSRIYSRGQLGSGPAYFEVETKSGHTMLFGGSADSAIEANGRVEIKKWSLNKISDVSGNYAEYFYAEYGNTASSCTVANLQIGESLPCRIDYTGNDAVPLTPFASVLFNYEDNPNVTIGYIGDTLETRSKRINNIQTFSEGGLVKSYRMSYRSNAANNRSQLTDIQECDGSVIEQCKRPIHLNWNEECTQPIAKHKTQLVHAEDWLTDYNSISGDFNGDGYSDIIRAGRVNSYFCAGPDVTSSNNCIVIATGDWKTNYQLQRGDFNGDGFLDLYLIGESENLACVGPGISTSNNCTQISQTQTLPAGNTVINWRDTYNINLGDYNGDGYTDLFLLGSSSNHFCAGPGILYSNNCEQANTSSLSGKYRAINGDFNGDGYSDLYLVGEAGSKFCAGPEITSSDNCAVIASVSWDLNNYGIYPADYNGDGYDDLYVTGVTGGYFCAGPNITSLNNCQQTLTGDWRTDFTIYPADYNSDGKSDLYLVSQTKHYYCDANSLTSGGSCVDVTPSVSAGELMQNDKGYPNTTDILGQQGCLLVTTVDDNYTNIDFTLDFGSTNSLTARCIRFLLDIYDPSTYKKTLEVATLVTSIDTLDVLNNTSSAFDIVSISNTTGLELPTQKSGFPVAQFNKKDLPPGYYEALIDIYINVSIAYRAVRIKFTGTVLPKQLGIDYKLLPGDYNGDGKIDLYMLGTKASYFAEGPDNSKNITKITDSLGNTTEFAYKSLADASVYTKGTTADNVYELDVQFPMQVVASQSVSNVTGALNNYAYTYTGAKINRDRGFLGFASQTIVDQQKNITTTTDYNQAYPYIGKPAHKLVTKLGGGKLSEASFDYLYHGTIGTPPAYRTAIFPYAWWTSVVTYDLSTEAAITTKTVVSSYDDFGNLTDKEVTTVDNTSGETFTEKTKSYYNYKDSLNWKIKRLVGSSLYSQTGTYGIKPTVVTSYIYDGGVATLGRLTKETVAGDTINQLTKDYSNLDSFGHFQTVTLSPSPSLTPVDETYFEPRSTTTVYEAKGRFPYTITNDLNHTETHTYDARFGALTDLVDANLLSSHWEYDSFARQTLEVRPDNTSKTIERKWDESVYVPNISQSLTHPGHQSLYSATVKELQTDGITQYVTPLTTYFDKNGKEIRKVSNGFDGTAVYIDANYDEYGRSITTSRPYYSNEINSTYPSHISYDVLDRITNTFSPTGATTQVLYSGLTTTNSVTFDGKSQTTKQTLNAIGQLKLVEDANLQTLTYGYQYTASGHLETVTDPQGNQIEMEFDSLGRKIRMKDPDMGEWHYAYNANNEQIWVTSPRHTAGAATGAAIYSNYNTYDTLGRLIKRTDYAIDGSVENESNWVYDTLSKGQLTSVNSTQEGGFTRAFTYDTLGRTDTITSTISFNNYIVDYGYNANDGRLKTIKYPTGFEVQHNYNASGYLHQVTDSTDITKVFWQGNSATSDGQFSNVDYGNGINVIRGFVPSTGQIDFINALDNVGTTVQYNDYGFDAIGNLTSRQDVLNSLHETFTYDSLNRLETTTLVGVGSSTMVYDALGNIKAKPGTASNYTYKTTTTRPHAVESISGTINASYLYDANGNFESGNGRTASWTSFDKPRTITKGSASSTFTYDAERNRITQNTANGLTVYLNPNTSAGAHFEKYFDSVNSTQENRHFIYAGENLVAVHKTKTAVPDKTEYFLKDHLGSTEVITDETGAVLEHLSYSAFGSYRNISDWSAPVAAIVALNTTRGYTGHEQLDELGLIHMNGRVYDAELGRFLSPDPVIQAPTNLQSYNRYSYVMNNPLSFTDPTGYYVDASSSTTQQFYGPPDPNNNFQFEDWLVIPDTHSIIGGTSYNVDTFFSFNSGSISSFDNSLSFLDSSVCPSCHSGDFSYNLPEYVTLGEQMEAGQFAGLATMSSVAVPATIAGGLYAGGWFFSTNFGASTLTLGRVSLLASEPLIFSEIAFSDGPVPLFRGIGISGKNDFVFRGDTRFESDIFVSGFMPRGNSFDLDAHVFNSRNSALIPTSRNAEVASEFGGNIYVIRPVNGIDLNQTLGMNRVPFPDEVEIAIPGPVLSSDIRAVTRGNVSILNPGYVP